MWLPVGGRLRPGEDDLLGVGVGELLRGDVVLVQHLPQDAVPLGLGGVLVFVGAVLRGAVGQAGQQGALGEVQLADVLAEVRLGGGLDAEGAAAVVDVVQVHRQDFLLGVVLLDAVGDEPLVQLAADGLFAGQPLHLHVAGELLGDGAAALGLAPAAEVLVERAGDALEVHALMLVKALVFKGDGGVLQVLGDALDGDDFAVLQIKVGEQGAVGGVDQGAPAGRVRERDALGHVLELDDEKRRRRDDDDQHQKRDDLEEDLDLVPEAAPLGPAPPPVRAGRTGTVAAGSVCAARRGRAGSGGPPGCACCCHITRTL